LTSPGFGHGGAFTSPANPVAASSIVKLIATNSLLKVFMLLLLQFCKLISILARPVASRYSELLQATRDGLNTSQNQFTQGFYHGQ
jgi:hypothetical protein